MKIFDVDVSVKHIAFELEGKQYWIDFRDNLQKGVHDISIWVNNSKVNAKITGAYPPLKKVFAILWRTDFPCWIKKKIKQYRRLHNR